MKVTEKVGALLRRSVKLRDEVGLDRAIPIFVASHAHYGSASVSQRDARDPDERPLTDERRFPHRKPNTERSAPRLSSLTR
jgi:hypothetical protein